MSNFFFYLYFFFKLIKVFLMKNRQKKNKIKNKQPPKHGKRNNGHGNITQYTENDFHEIKIN